MKLTFAYALQAATLHALRNKTGAAGAGKQELTAFEERCLQMQARASYEGM